MLRREELLVEVAPHQRLAVTIVGEGPTVLVTNRCFLHADLDPLANGRRLVFVDTRGRGGSDPVAADDATFGSDQMVDDLDVVRRHLGEDCVDLFGWSAGGGLATSYALDHPEHVGRVLTAAWVPPRSTPPSDADFDEMRRRAAERAPSSHNSVDPREAFLAGAAFQTPHIDRLRERMESTPWAHANEQGDAWRSLVERAASAPRRKRPSRFIHPLLVVFGDADRGPLRDARDWRLQFDDARLLVLEDVGHYPWLEAPERFFAAADSFFDGGWPEPTEVLGVSA